MFSTDITNAQTGISTLTGVDTTSFNGPSLTLTGTNLDISSVTDTGNGFDIANSATQIGLSAGAQASLTGADNTLQANAGDDLSLSGGGNTVTLTGADAAVTLNGTDDSFDAVYATGDALGGAAADGQASGIVLGANTQANVSGSNDGVTLAGGATLGLYGGGNTVNAGSDEFVVLGSTNGSFDTVNASGDQFGGTTADGSGSQIALNPNTEANINGSDDGISVYSGSVAGIYGGGNTVDAGSDDFIVLGSTNASFDTVNASGDQFGSTTADGAGSQIAIASDTEADINGSDDGISVYSGSIVDIYGGDNTIDGGADENISLFDTDGDADAVNASNDEPGSTASDGDGTGIYLGGDAQANISGAGNGINLSAGDTVGLYGGGDTINAGAGESLSIYDTDDNFDTISATNDTFGSAAPDGLATGIYIDDASQVDVDGSGDGVSLATGATAGIYGGGNTVYAGADDFIVLGSTNGSFDTVNASGDQFGSTTANGAGSEIALNPNTEAVINGSDDGVSVYGGSVADIYGGGDTIDAGADENISLSDTDGDADVVNASNDALGGAASNGAPTGIYLAGDVQFNLSGNSDGVSLGTGDTVSLTGGGNVISDGDNDSISIQDTDNDYDFVLASNDALGGEASNGAATGVYLGADAQVSFTGSSDGISLATGDTVYVSGGGDTIDGGADESISLFSTNDDWDTVNIFGDALGGTASNGVATGIWLAGDVQASVGGGDDGIELATGDSAHIFSGGNTIAGGAGESISIIDSNDNFDTVNASGDQFGGAASDGDGTGIFLDNDAQANISGSNDGVSVYTGDTAGIYGGGNTVDAGSDEFVVLGATNGSFDSVNASGDQFGGTTADGAGAEIALNPDTEANITGSDDGISVYSGSVAGIYGGGNTVDAGSDDFIVLGSTNGSFDSVNASGDQFGGTTADGAGAEIALNPNTEANITGSNDGISVYSGSTANVYGGDNTLYAGDDVVVDLSGTNGNSDIIYSSGAVIYLGDDTQADIQGGDDIIIGGLSDNIDVSGSEDIVDADDSTVNIAGGYNGDFVGGSGDDGLGWDYGDGEGYGYGYDLAASSKNGASASINQVALYDATAPASGSISAAAQAARTIAFDSAAASEAGTTAPSAIFENAVWTSDVITWSFAAGGSSSEFSSSMTAQEEAVVEQAVQAWAAASGLIFEEVPDSPSADIRIGLGDFNSSNSGVLGYTSYLSDAGQLEPGAVVRLEDPTETPLAADTAGDLTYMGADATFYQVALHEIGHALGLADNADPDSVMYYQASTANQQLDATDVAEITALYGSLTGVGAASDSTDSSTDAATGSSSMAIAATISVAASGATSVTTSAATPTSVADTTSSGSVSQTIQDNFSPAIAQLINAMAVFGASTELATAASIPVNTNLNTETALAASA